MDALHRFLSFSIRHTRKLAFQFFCSFDLHCLYFVLSLLCGSRMLSHAGSRFGSISNEERDDFFPRRKERRRMQKMKLKATNKGNVMPLEEPSIDCLLLTESFSGLSKHRNCISVSTKALVFFPLNFSFVVYIHLSFCFPFGMKVFSATR